MPSHRCRPRRRRGAPAGRIAVVAATLALLPAFPVARGQTPPPVVTTNTVPVGLESIGTFGGGPPLAMGYAQDGTDRLFVAGQFNGQVKLYKNGAFQSTPFLDVTAGGLSLSASGEKGLLGIAFHPNFAAPAGTPGSGKFYTFTSETKGGTTAGVDFIHPELAPTNAGDCDSVIREWSVDPAHPDVVNTGAGSRVIMRIRKPQANHNGGDLHFGPDGYLYVGTGDGGGGNDNNGGASSTTDGHTNSVGNAQDLGQIYGKMLRIDPVLPSAKPASTDPVSSNGQYRIPQSNPFAGATAGLDEIYAYGLRNPWRFSFDRGGSHQLFAADVGQAAREEVDVVTKGGNYGWVFREGSQDNGGAGRTKPTGFTSIDPIAEYTHTDGQAIIGGYVYRGQNIPELVGKYVFGDLGVGSPSHGRLFYTDSAGGTISEFTYALNAPSAQLYAFGEDKDGELYAMFANGAVARLLGRQWRTDGGGSWGTSSNWIAAVPNAAGASANFFAQLKTPANAPATVTLDGARTVGNLRFGNTVTNGSNPNSYILAAGSGGALTIDGGTSAGLVQVLKGTHAVNVPVTISSAATVDIASASKLTFGSPVTVAAGKSIQKTGSGSAVFSQPVTFAGSGSVTVQGGDFTLAPGSGASRFGAVSVTGGKLDVKNNQLVLTGTPVGTWTGSAYTGASGLVDAGRNGGAWNGVGIVTTDSRAVNSRDFTTLGVATAQQVLGIGSTATGTWHGRTVQGADTLVAFTYGGDATLDGRINIDDYGRIDANVGSSGAVGGWFNGDFNYDGKINVDDYGIIDGNIGKQAAPLGAAQALAGFAIQAVPEPAASLVPLAVPSVLLTRRCRARKSRLR